MNLKNGTNFSERAVLPYILNEAFLTADLVDDSVGAFLCFFSTLII